MVQQCWCWDNGVLFRSAVLYDQVGHSQSTSKTTSHLHCERRWINCRPSSTNPKSKFTGVGSWKRHTQSSDGSDWLSTASSEIPMHEGCIDEHVEWNEGENSDHRKTKDLLGSVNAYQVRAWCRSRVFHNLGRRLETMIIPHPYAYTKYRG